MVDSFRETKHVENSISRAADRKNQYYSLLYSEMAERKRVEENLRRLNLLLQAVSQAQLNYVAGTNLAEVFSSLLQTLLDVTEGWQGFLREEISREQESEADHIGIRYAAKAGYDPRAAITFWEKMAKQKGNASTIKWLSTHPPDDQRIASLQRLMPEAMQLYDAARGIKPAAADRPIGL